MSDTHKTNYMIWCTHKNALFSNKHAVPVCCRMLGRTQSSFQRNIFNSFLFPVGHRHWETVRNRKWPTPNSWSVTFTWKHRTIHAILTTKQFFINPTDAHYYKITGILKQLKFRQLLRHVSVHSGTIIRELFRA